MAETHAVRILNEDAAAINGIAFETNGFPNRVGILEIRSATDLDFRVLFSQLAEFQQGGSSQRAG